MNLPLTGFRIANVVVVKNTETDETALVHSQRQARLIEEVYVLALKCHNPAYLSQSRIGTHVDSCATCPAEFGESKPQ